MVARQENYPIKPKKNGTIGKQKPRHSCPPLLALPSFIRPHVCHMAVSNYDRRQNGFYRFSQFQRMFTRD